MATLTIKQIREDFKQSPKTDSPAKYGVRAVRAWSQCIQKEVKRVKTIERLCGWLEEDTQLPKTVLEPDAPFYGNCLAEVLEDVGVVTEAVPDVVQRRSLAPIQVEPQPVPRKPKNTPHVNTFGADRTLITKPVASATLKTRQGEYVDMKTIRDLPRQMTSQSLHQYRFGEVKSNSPVKKSVPSGTSLPKKHVPNIAQPRMKDDSINNQIFWQSEIARRIQCDLGNEDSRMFKADQPIETSAALMSIWTKPINFETVMTRVLLLSLAQSIQPNQTKQRPATSTDRPQSELKPLPMDENSRYVPKEHANSSPATPSWNTSLKRLAEPTDIPMNGVETSDDQDPSSLLDQKIGHLFSEAEKKAGRKTYPQPVTALASPVIAPISSQKLNLAGKSLLHTPAEDGWLEPSNRIAEERHREGSAESEEDLYLLAGKIKQILNEEARRFGIDV